MEQHLYDLLRAAVAWRVSWGTMGHGTSLPRASIFRTGGSRDMTLAGPGLMNVRLQIDVYADTFEGALAASKEVGAVLEGYRGGPIKGAFLEAIRDGFDDDAALLQRVSLTFSITYRD